MYFYNFTGNCGKSPRKSYIGAKGPNVHLKVFKVKDVGVFRVRKREKRRTENGTREKDDGRKRVRGRVLSQEKPVIMCHDLLWVDTI